MSKAVRINHENAPLMLSVLGESVSIRPVSVQDACIIAAHRHYSPSALAADRDTYAAWVSAAIERGSYLGFVCEHNTDVIAGAGLTLLDWGPVRGQPQSVRGRVVNVFTKIEWRGRGIASHLTRKLISKGGELGIATFNLASTGDSRGIYTKLGFAPYPDEMILRVDT